MVASAQSLDGSETTAVASSSGAATPEPNHQRTFSAPTRTSSNINYNLDIVIENPTPHRLPEGENATPLEVIGTTASDKLVIVMVGLPATGEY
jgi:hypothetical protein